jgi:hypothetical protein
VVAHTHWDREWYHPAERFRQRLVPLLDFVLASAPAASGGASASPQPFLLDGQAITLVDYLAVRPQAEAALAAALRAGALEAGPWFVLADALIPSGEALVRNLEAGRRTLARLGATAPAVAYCPDSFGHPAALPAIAAGFGLPVAIVWRGLGGAAHPAAAALRWRAPDGRSVVAWHLPRDGYEIGRDLPVAPEAARARWEALRPVVADRCAEGPWLLLNGADHHARQPGLPEAVAALGEAAAPEARVRRGTLQGFADALQRHGEGQSLPEVTGELRDSYGYTWTLGGTLATRAHQKRRNARLERRLLRDVEPWGALAWWHAPAWGRSVAATGHATLVQWPALLACVWETLLATHPHDTLCGCSIDGVARAMEARQDAAAAQARGLRTDALALALGHDPVAARGQALPASPAVLLRNRAGSPRGGVALLTVAETLGDEPVGPGSGDEPGPALDAPGRPRHRAGLLGLPLVQPVAHGVAHHRRESPQHYPDNDLVRVRRVLAWVPEVPAFGVRMLAGRTDAPMAPLPPEVRTSAGDAAAQAGSLWIAHDQLRVELRDGRVEVTAHDDGAPRHLADALWLETQADAGDSYTPSPRGAVTRLELVRGEVVERGPLRATLRLHWWLPGGDPDAVPSALAEATGRKGYPTRLPARQQGAVRVVTDLALVAGSPLLRCRVTGINRRRNHRLRLVWGTALTPDAVVADAAFGPVRRDPPTPPTHAREAVPDGMPLHRWISVASGGLGAALLSDGLAEAVVAPGRLGVTLVRAVGELSRARLPERPGHAGWPAATSAAQVQGRFAAQVALWLHGPHGDALWAALSRHADDLLLPLVGTPWRDPLPPWAREGDAALAGPRLLGDGLEASTVTLTDDAAAVVLRAVNLTERPVYGAWALPDPAAQAPEPDQAGWWVVPCRMDGTPEGPAIPLRNGRVPLEVPPRGIVTVQLRRDPPSA